MRRGWHLLIRADGAGSSHGLLDWFTAQGALHRVRRTALVRQGRALVDAAERL